MLFAKFVTEDFLSPGSYGKIDYSLFGEPIEVDAVPTSVGQCASGIHVIPLQEDIDFMNVLWTSTIIILEADETDIAFQEGNGKIRLRKATPLREANEEEMGIIRNAVCKNPESAYWYALYSDKKPTDQTRDAVCKSAVTAFVYACNVDRTPLEQTRNAACEEARWAYYYAYQVDKSPSEQTRNAAFQKPRWAYFYALNVDKAPSEQAFLAVSQDEYWSGRYTEFVTTLSDNPV